MSKISFIPTPIGNLEDISLRALRYLKEVDLILAEDTRVSKKLLNHYEIRTPIQSFHAHNEHHQVQNIIELALSGKHIALVSDAGTPGISDPGFLLARAAVEAKLEIECLPGPTALIPALVKSGLPCDRFYFEGFLPHKKGRQTRLQYLAELDQTFVLYESPYRVVKSLTQLAEALGEERKTSVSRELSKKFEETVHGTLGELILHFSKKAPKGEFVFVIEGKAKPTKSKKYKD